MTEPILVENKDRFVLFPIKYKDIWEFYKKAEASFWTAEEIDLASDTADWNNKLNDNEKHFIREALYQARARVFCRKRRHRERKPGHQLPERGSVP
jgi:ribonucleotide reductase beta subunit family protein with ferritin-like domain